MEYRRLQVDAGKETAANTMVLRITDRLSARPPPRGRGIAIGADNKGGTDRFLDSLAGNRDLRSGAGPNCRDPGRSQGRSSLFRRPSESRFLERWMRESE